MTSTPTPLSTTVGAYLLSGLLIAVGTLGLRPVFDGWQFLLPVVAGLFVGLGVAAFARWKRLYLGETLALSLLAFGVVGTIVIVGPGDPFGFARSLVSGWADLLSASPPAALTPSLRTVPYAIAWFGAALSGELIRRKAPTISVAVGPVAVLVVTGLLTVENQTIAVAQGVLFVCGLLCLAYLASGQSSKHVFGLKGSLAVGAAVVSIGVIAGLIGPSMPTPTQRDRFDLRAYQERPWDPLDEPSPLVTIKASLKEDSRDDERFIVTAADPIERFSIATLSTYAGTVWTVADVEASGASQFTPIDRGFPDSATVFGSDVSYDIEFVGGTDPWVPLSGWPRLVEVVGSDTGLRFNAETGTVAWPSGLRPGTRVSVTALQSEMLSLDEVAKLTTVPSPASGSELDLIPPAFVNLAGDMFEGADRGSEHVTALAHAFTTTGFYDATNIARPGHSLARLSEFFADTDTLIGYEEQFAAGAAVLLRIDGIAARVVVGYVVPPDRYVDGSAVVLAGDSSAWIEVLTEERGWVAVDVTPDRAREPEADVTGRSIQEIATPNPPPPPSPQPDPAPISQPDASEDELEEPEADPDLLPIIGQYRWVGVVALGLVTPVMGAGLAGGLVVFLKRRRRRRRLGASDSRQQINGAWSELCDRFIEHGLQPRRSATPTELAIATLATLDHEPALNEPVERLAQAVDRATFHPSDPTADAVSAAWVDYETAAACLRSGHRRRQRVAHLVDPRPLRKDPAHGRR